MRLINIIVGVCAIMIGVGCEQLDVLLEPTAGPTEPTSSPSEPRDQGGRDEPVADAGEAEGRSAGEESATGVLRGELTNRAVAMFTVAGGLDQPEQLHFTDLVWERGWDAYIREVVQPDIDLGFRRLIALKACGMQGESAASESRWNIVGERPKTRTMTRSRALTWSQLHARRPDLADTFVASWSRVGAQVDELILYIGLPAPDATNAEIEAWCDPLLSIPNVSIGLDSLGAISPDNAGGRLLDYLLKRGVRVYVEPVMPRDEWDVWPTDHPDFAVATLDKRFELLQKKNTRWPTLSEAGDELLVLVQGRGGEPTEERAQRIQRYLATTRDEPVSIAFGTRGMSDVRIRSLISLGRR